MRTGRPACFLLLLRLGDLVHALFKAPNRVFGVLPDSDGSGSFRVMSCNFWEAVAAVAADSASPWLPAADCASMQLRGARGRAFLTCGDRSWVWSARVCSDRLSAWLQGPHRETRRRTRRGRRAQPCHASNIEQNSACSMQCLQCAAGPSRADVHGGCLRHIRVLCCPSQQSLHSRHSRAQQQAAV